MIEILPRLLNMDRKRPKLAICSHTFCFIILRGDLNICCCEQMENLQACAAVLWMLCPPGLRASHMTKSHELNRTH